MIENTQWFPLYLEYHTLEHEFDRIDYAEVPYYQGDDYSEFMGEYSYLDPVGYQDFFSGRMVSYVELLVMISVPRTIIRSA